MASPLGRCARYIYPLGPTPSIGSDVLAASSGNPGGCVSDGIRKVDELVGDAEAVGHDLPEPADSERLGRVVARRDEVDSGLARLPGDALGRLAGEECVERALCRLRQAVAGAARDDAER